MAEMGSVHFCRPGKPKAAWYDEAELFTGASPKLPDLECALASLELDVDSPAPVCNGGRPRGPCLPSWGALFEPMGVTTLSFGGWGRDWRGFPFASFVTGRWFGEGGMERPRAGGPLLPGRAPGMGGRRRGAGADMSGSGCGEGPLLDDCIYVVCLPQKKHACRSGGGWYGCVVVKLHVERRPGPTEWVAADSRARQAAAWLGERVREKGKRREGKKEGEVGEAKESSSSGQRAERESKRGGERGRSGLGTSDVGGHESLMAGAGSGRELASGRASSGGLFFFPLAGGAARREMEYGETSEQLPRKRKRERALWVSRVERAGGARDGGGECRRVHARLAGKGARR